MIIECTFQTQMVQSDGLNTYIIHSKKYLSESCLVEINLYWCQCIKEREWPTGSSGRKLAIEKSVEVKNYFYINSDCMHHYQILL